MVYSLGTVINANNSNNKTSLAITTTTNNYVHLILLSSCLLLSASRTLHVFSTLVYSTLIFLPTLASFPSSHRALLVIVGAAAVAVAFVVVVSVDLFFLNTILISAMLPIPPSTHILFLFFLLLSFAVPHTASTLFYLFDLLANPSIGSTSRPPVLDSMGHWHSTSSRILDVFSTDRHLCGHFLTTHFPERT